MYTSESPVWRFLVGRVLQQPTIPSKTRVAVLNRLGASIDPTARIRHRVEVTSNQLSIGPDSFVNFGVVIHNRVQVEIGANVLIGPRAMLLTITHVIGGPDRRAADGKLGAVTVGDGVWVGAGSVILPGIEIAAGCVIGAGAVVTRSTEPNGLYVGAPARRLRDL